MMPGRPKKSLFSFFEKEWNVFFWCQILSPDTFLRRSKLYHLSWKNLVSRLFIFEVVIHCLPYCVLLLETVVNHPIQLSVRRMIYETRFVSVSPWRQTREEDGDRKKKMIRCQQVILSCLSRPEITSYWLFKMEEQSQPWGARRR